MNKCPIDAGKMCNTSRASIYVCSVCVWYTWLWVMVELKKRKKNAKDLGVFYIYISTAASSYTQRKQNSYLGDKKRNYDIIVRLTATHFDLNDCCLRLGR